MQVSILHGCSERNGLRLIHIPERFTAEVQREYPVFMIAQYLGQFDLIGQPGIIKAARTSGQLERSGSL